MISVRMDPAGHPVPDDRPGRLLADAVRASRRRAIATTPIKAAFVAWFAAMAVLPRRLARPVAELFLFPERRSAVNSLLGRLQRH